MYIRQLSVTTSSENVPNSQSSTYRRKYYHLFKQNFLSGHIRKNTHYWIRFLVHLWNHGKNSQDLRDQNTCTTKMLDWCNITFRHLS